MKYKKYLITIGLIMCIFFTISSVAASDTNNTEISIENQISSFEQDIDEIHSNPNNVPSTASETPLNNSDGTFTDFVNDLANAGEEFNLTRDYVYDENVDKKYYESGINYYIQSHNPNVTKLVINGNNHVINANNQAAMFNQQTFYNTTIKNVTFANYIWKHSNSFYLRGGNSSLENCKFINATCPVIIGISSCIVSNCEFINCSSTAIEFQQSYSKYSTLKNCNFINCSKKSITYSQGGAVLWSSDYGLLTNCSFLNCYAENYIPDIEMTGGEGTVDNLGGAIAWLGNVGTITNSTFKNCFVRSEHSYKNKTCNNNGGAIFIWANGCTISNSVIENCSAYSAYECNNLGGAVNFHGNYRNGGTLINCTFINNHAGKGGGVYFGLNNGKMIQCTFINNTATENGNAIYWTGAKGNISNSIILPSNSNHTIYYYNNESPTRLFLENNWWGNTIEDYDVDNACGLTIKNWYVLNLTSNEEFVIGKDTPIRIDLTNLYDKSTITHVKNCNLPNIKLNVNTVNASSDKEITSLENGASSINYTPLERMSLVNVSYYGVSLSKKFTSKYQIDFNITVEDTIYPNRAVVLIDTDFDSNYTVDINGKIYEITTNKGRGNITSDILAAKDNYTVTVTCKGNEDYDSINKTVFFNIKKQETVINISANDINYGKNATITIKSNADGTYAVTINNISQDVNVINGIGNITISNLAAENDISVICTFEGNENYTVSSNSTTFNVFKITPIINVEANNVTYPENIEINITTTASGEYMVSTNNYSKIIALESDIINCIKLDVLAAGEYDITLSFEGNENYTSINITLAVNISKQKIDSISLTIDDVIYPNVATINIEASLDGIYFITIGNTTKEVNITNGKTNLTLDLLNAGTYTATVKFNDEENYTNTSNQTSFTVEKGATQTTVLEINGTLNHELTITANITSLNNVNEGKVIFYDGETVIGESYVENSIASITYTPTSSGEHEITAIFNATNYLNSTDTAKMLIDTIELNVLFDNSTVGNNTRFIANVKGLYSIINEGKITLRINEEVIGSEDVINGTALLNYTPTTAGTYNISLTYTGSDNFDDMEITSKITISPANSAVRADDIETAYLNSTSITVISENATGIKYQIIKDGVIIQENTTTDTITITGLPVGTYTLNLTTIVDENHIQATNASSITVIRANVTMFMVSIAEHPVGTPATVHVSIFPQISEGTVTFYINGKFAETSNVENGRANMTFTPTSVEKYNITATFSGDNFNDETQTGSVFVVPIHTSLSINSPESVYVNDKITFNISLSPGIDGQLKYYIGNDTDGVANVTNGTCIITYTPKTIGEVSIFALYEASTNYSSSYVMNTVKVVGRSTTLTASAVTTVYNGGKYLTVTLKDQNKNAIKGAKISIKLNGKTSNLTTNAKGQVKLSTNGIAPNTYTAKITFAGNNKYLKSSKNVKVTVKKATPKLTTKLNKYRAVAKVKRYYVTLKTNQNKIMKNCLITFKVNGRTFSARTNAKGVATFNVNNIAKMGIYTALVKYSGNKYYNAVSKKVKISVLK